jgi:omega-6 fatty acid desaturase (delta-12 desaturase)
LTSIEVQPAPPSRSWRAELAPYAQPSIPRSAVDLATSVVPYVLLTAVIAWLVPRSLPLALLLSPLAAGFLLRSYIIFHDCTHGSFLPGKHANMWLGRALGLLVYSDFESWRHSHAVHHATAGDLDRRGTGDVPTWTVAEYNAHGRVGRLGYWLFRHPLVMFLLGPIWALIVSPRLIKRSQRPRIRRSILLTNIAVLAMVAGLVWLLGWQTYLLAIWPAALIAGSAGVFLFYVQHQFEDVYWESAENWSYDDAALRGSSYLHLSPPLRFFTGNIGFHHVHHLSARVPNYNLPRAHRDHPVFASVPTLTLTSALPTVRLKLWDETTGRLVTFREARATRGAAL